jgi:hypothetical protein
MFGVGCVANILDERFRHGNFVRTIFSERYADGVANSIRQQRPDSDRALDARIFAFAGLGYSEMQRVIPVRAQFV